VASDRNDDRTASRGATSQPALERRRGHRGRRRLFGSRANAAPNVAAGFSAPTIASSPPSIGIRGQGNALKRGSRASERRDQDALRHRRESVSVARQRRKAERRAHVQAGYAQDLRRRARRQKTSTAIVIAVPNHWHALATIWGCRPASTCTSRSRRRTPCGRPQDGRGAGSTARSYKSGR